MYWLSYGGGLNSTALACLLIDGALTELRPLRIVFSDTGDERPETYGYIERHFEPYLDGRGFVLETVRPSETVLERWKRYRVTGSRLIRSCTQYAKRYPIRDHLRKEGGAADISLIGIDADESHRAKERDGIRYPLVELGIGRDECTAIVAAAGLPIPVKSGCWHCPFLRVREIEALALNHPARFAEIEELERVANEAHPEQLRTQWGDRPAAYWRERAKNRVALPLFDTSPPVCNECYDGGDD